MATRRSLFFQNAVGSLFEHPAGYATLVYHAGPRLPADLQTLLRQAAKLLRRNHWRKAMTDQRHMRPFLPSEMAEILAFWQDEFQQRDIHFYAAAVLGENIFARTVTYPLVHQMSSPLITYQVFEDESSARAWLQQKE